MLHTVNQINLCTMTHVRSARGDSQTRTHAHGRTSLMFARRSIVRERESVSENVRMKRQVVVVDT